MSKESQNIEMTFWDHLEELRWVFIRSLIAIVAIGIVAFLNKNLVFNWVFLAPKEPWFITNDLLCRFSNFLNS
ncbi:MAG: twin-arginine translocase subunit TatC, partial [Bacteroidetes bacterium]